MDRGDEFEVALVDVHKNALTRSEDEIISRIVTSLTLAETPGEVLEQVLEILCAGTGFDIGEVWQPDDADNLLERSAAFTVQDDRCQNFVRLSTGMTFPPGIGLPGRVWEAGEVEWHDRLPQEWTPLSRVNLARAAGLCSAVGIPIRNGDGKTQCVVLLAARRPRPFNSRLMDLFSKAGQRIANLLNRRRTENALKFSEDRYRDISALTSDIYYSYTVRDDGSMELDWLSGTLPGIKERFYRNTSEIGLFGEIGDPRDRDAISSRLAKLKSGEPDTREVRAIDSDGNSRWLRVVGIPRLDSGGRLVSIIGAVSDIHARKTAEIALAESSRRIRQHLRERQSLYELVTFLAESNGEPAAQFLESCCRTIQQASPDTVNTHVRLRVDSEIAETAGFTSSRSRIGESMFAATGSRLEVEIHFPDHPEIQPRLHDWHVFLAQVMSHLKAAVDRHATIRVQSEDAQRYRQIVQSQAELVSRISVRGSRLFANDSLCRFLGLSRSEILGTSFWDQVLPEEAPRIRRHFASLSEARPWSTYVGSLPRWDGERRYIEWTDYGTFRNGSLEEVLGVGRDVTDRVVAERALENSRREMQDRQLMLERVHRHLTMSELGAGIAHQMNQPLNAVANYLGASQQILRSRPSQLQERDTEVLDLIDRAQSQVMRTGRMIREINDFLRSPARTPEQVDLNVLCTQCVQLARPSIEAMGISLEVLLSKTPLRVNVVPVEVEQVLLCLLFNAAESYSIDKYSSGRFVRISCLQENGGAVTKVVDAGQGLPENVEPEKLFGALFSTKPQGQGMGLAIAKVIAERHSGKIGIANRAEGGAEVTIWIPTVD